MLRYKIYLFTRHQATENISNLKYSDSLFSGNKLNTGLNSLILLRP